jgi:hypothetical protein
MGRGAMVGNMVNLYSNIVMILSIFCFKPLAFRDLQT